jgi:hypothetical protein
VKQSLEQALGVSKYYMTTVARHLCNIILHSIMASAALTEDDYRRATQLLTQDPDLEKSHFQYVEGMPDLLRSLPGALALPLPEEELAFLSTWLSKLTWNLWKEKTIGTAYWMEPHHLCLSARFVSRHPWSTILGLVAYQDRTSWDIFVTDSARDLDIPFEMAHTWFEFLADVRSKGEEAARKYLED